MISLKDMCQCIGRNVSGEVSVIHDFFGFWNGSSPSEVSVMTQIQRLQGKHVHANFITVGTFSNADMLEIDQALVAMRNLYAPVNLGVGRIEWYGISAAEAAGRDNIGSDSEAEALTDEWTVHNSALDIFFVLTYAGSTIGLSRVDGPCDKDAKGMDGSVVAIEGSANTTGYVLAHEAGHYLGLSHVNDGNNLMNPSVPNGGALSSGQGGNMRNHCFVKSAC